MIFRGSRYSKSKIYSITRERRDGTVEVRRYVTPPDLENIDLGSQFSITRIDSSVDLDAMAHRASAGRSDKWWLIAHFSQVSDPFAIPDGTEITIPSFGTFASV